MLVVQGICELLQLDRRGRLTAVLGKVASAEAMEEAVKTFLGDVGRDLLDTDGLKTEGRSQGGVRHGKGGRKEGRCSNRYACSRTS